MPREGVHHSEEVKRLQAVLISDQIGPHTVNCHSLAYIRFVIVSLSCTVQRRRLG